MSDPEPVRRHQFPFLRDRVAAMFLPPSPSRIDGERSSLQQEETEGDTNARTRLLESYHNREAACGSKHCDHGTFSPKAASHHNRSMSPIEGFDESRYLGRFHDGLSDMHDGDGHDGISSLPIENEGGMSTTKQLARKHGVKHQRTMYVGSVYIS